MYEDKILKSLKVLNETNLNNITCLNDLKILGNISCPKIFINKNDNLIFNYNLLSNGSNLGTRKLPWNEIHTNILEVVKNYSYDINVSNNVIMGNNSNNEPIIKISSSETNDIDIAMNVDYCFIGSTLKIGAHLKEKKNFYLNPYNHICYFNTNIFSISDFTLSKKIFNIDSSNIEIEALNLKLSLNTLEYPTFIADNDIFNIDNCICYLDFNTLDIKICYYFYLNLKKSSMCTFYNIKNVPINLCYQSTIYNFNKKLEFYFDIITQNITIILNN